MILAPPTVAGEGNLGEVWEGELTEKGGAKRPVAVKRIPSAVGEQALKMFRDELRVLHRWPRCRHAQLGLALPVRALTLLTLCPPVQTLALLTLRPACACSHSVLRIRPC